MHSNYEFHPWEIWNGGECPCPDELVQVQLACDTRSDAEGNNNTALARYFSWSHEGYIGDIIAFRRVKKPEVHIVYGHFADDDVWYFGPTDYTSDTHKLTFNVDSEGNPYNFQCERIK